MTSACGIATSSANEPGPLKPGCHWSGQTWAFPDAHQAQVPQPQTNGTTTRSPTRARTFPVEGARAEASWRTCASTSPSGATTRTATPAVAVPVAPTFTSSVFSARGGPFSTGF